jgi:hypothetical protein
MPNITFHKPTCQDKSGAVFEFWITSGSPKIIGQFNESLSAKPSYLGPVPLEGSSGIRDGWRMLFILVSLCWNRDAMLRPVCSETEFTDEMIGGHVSIVAANCLSSRVIESSPNS